MEYMFKHWNASMIWATIAFALFAVMTIVGKPENISPDTEYLSTLLLIGVSAIYSAVWGCIFYLEAKLKGR